MFQPHNKSNINFQELPDSAVSTTLSCFNWCKIAKCCNWWVSFLVSRFTTRIFSLRKSRQNKGKLTGKDNPIQEKGAEVFSFLIFPLLGYFGNTFSTYVKNSLISFLPVFFFSLVCSCFYYFFPFFHSLFAFMNSKKYFGFTYSP